MTKLTVKEHMFIKTVPSTLANGKMIYNTVKVLRPGQMDRVMMVSTKMVKNTETVNIVGPTVHATMETGMKTKSEAT